MTHDEIDQLARWYIGSRHRRQRLEHDLLAARVALRVAESRFCAADAIIAEHCIASASPTAAIMEAVASLGKGKADMGRATASIADLEGELAEATTAEADALDVLTAAIGLHEMPRLSRAVQRPGIDPRTDFEH